MLDVCTDKRLLDDDAFGAAGFGLWNSLPLHLKDADNPDISYSELRRFGQWGHGAV